ncbi:hemerythrin-like domain-containing protein [Janthinobacterium sp. CG_23.3]|uniref:hemerythrin domain-containing protein n=1 Tax=unclassified Janthinobacterium TaxID=2610881 RepID=UPI000348A054|nr:MULTISPECIES: hemerythrin domain-containing protein [unclassified Janthinobacterium]MEC5160384.1 hemerythrin-like domain-containing protein [Janthinobacterium sp. CG_S6]
MLTATYALMTLSIEQKRERNFISRFRHYLQVNAGAPQKMDPVRLANQLDELTRFAEMRHQRKVEGCLMPALRQATHDADTLLADLETLNRIGRHTLGSARRRLRLAFAESATHVKMLCFTLERYCENLLERLAKEEQELLPLAQRVISSEQWFAIGTTFLSYDAAQNERRRKSTLPRLRWHSRPPAS